MPDFWLARCKNARILLSQNIDSCMIKMPELEVKFGGKKKYLPIGPVWTYAPGVSCIGIYIFQPIFVAPWLKSMFIIIFERSISYLFGDQSLRLLNDF